MTKQDRVLCVLYLAVAAGALVATWSQNIRFFLRDGDGGLWGFIEACYANPAAASITNDVIFVLLAAWILMWVESRRLKIPHLWAYYLLSLGIAISVTFPVFLYARQRRLAVLRATAPEPAA
ncbi:DUF2834 domain-containing protein [Actinocorallia longicatena]